MKGRFAAGTHLAADWSVSQTPPSEDLGAGEPEKAEEVLGLPLPSTDETSLAEQAGKDPLGGAVRRIRSTALSASRGSR